MKSGKTLIKVLIAMFPLILIGMVIVGALLYNQRRIDRTEDSPMTREITVKNMVSHYEKLRDFMSPRGFSDQQEVLYSIRTAAFVLGSVDTINTGMHVESKNVLTEAERLWKSYTLRFGKGGIERTLTINYITASNAEIAVAIMITEALPQTELKDRVTIVFTPSEKSSPEIAQWVSEAKQAGIDNPLNIDGYDWGNIQSKILEYISDL